MTPTGKGYYKNRGKINNGRFEFGRSCSIFFHCLPFSKASTIYGFNLGLYGMHDSLPNAFNLNSTKLNTTLNLKFHRWI